MSGPSSLIFLAFWACFKDETVCLVSPGRISTHISTSGKLIKMLHFNGAPTKNSNIIDSSDTVHHFCPDIDATFDWDKLGILKCRKVL